MIGVMRRGEKQLLFLHEDIRVWTLSQKLDLGAKMRATNEHTRACQRVQEHPNGAKIPSLQHLICVDDRKALIWVCPWLAQAAFAVQADCC